MRSATSRSGSRTKRQIAHMAHHDALTDLPNRSLLRERLEQALVRVGDGEALAVMCLDLDRFKEVNDTLGHPVGDALLKIGRRAAARLRAARPTRWRGSAATSSPCCRAACRSRSEATALATRIIEALSAPYLVNGHQIVVGASVGIALSPDDSIDADQLLQSADMALYRAKREGRSTYRFFEQGMDARMRARRALEMDLRKALANGEFELLLPADRQPRAQPVLGLRGAAALEASAARHGLAGGVHSARRGDRPDRADRRMGAARGVRRSGHVGRRISRSRSTCRPASSRAGIWCQAVVSAIASVGTRRRSGWSWRSPRRSCCRTADATLRHAAPAAGHRACGSRSTISAPAIRRSAICAASRSTRSRSTARSSAAWRRTAEESLAIVRAVSQLGASLGMCTTAEGVETESQLDTVRAEGCTEVQGYFFSAARPAHEIAALLARGIEPASAAA